jgi:hypothetical protein
MVPALITRRVAARAARSLVAVTDDATMNEKMLPRNRVRPR